MEIHLAFGKSKVDRLSVFLIGDFRGKACDILLINSTRREVRSFDLVSSLKPQLPLRSNSSSARKPWYSAREPLRAEILTFGGTGYQDILPQCPVKASGKLQQFVVRWDCSWGEFVGCRCGRLRGSGIWERCPRQMFLRSSSLPQEGFTSGRRAPPLPVTDLKSYIFLPGPFLQPCHRVHTEVGTRPRLASSVH